MELAELVRARNHLHAAGLDRGVGERDPGGHLQGRLDAEVGRILVPAHIGRVASVLGPDREMEQTDIRTDDVLDGVEDGWMVDDLVDPGEQEMRLEIVPFGEFSALGRLELLHGASVPPRLLGGERVDRVAEAVAVVALDLGLGQPLAHRRHPTPQRRAYFGTSCHGAWPRYLLLQLAGSHCRCSTRMSSSLLNRNVPPARSCCVQGALAT